MRGGWVQTTETLRDTIAMRVPALLIGWSISCLGVWAETPQAVAIRNATVVTVSGPVLARATVVLRGGLIEAAGANAAIPPDAWIVDGEGLTVYPGLIDAASNWGMPANLAPAAGGRGGRGGQGTAANGPPARGPEDRP